MPRRDTSGRLTYLVQKAKPMELKDKDSWARWRKIAEKPEEEEDDEKETLTDSGKF